MNVTKVNYLTALIIVTQQNSTITMLCYNSKACLVIHKKTYSFKNGASDITSSSLLKYVINTFRGLPVRLFIAEKHYTHRALGLANLKPSSQCFPPWILGRFWEK